MNERALIAMLVLIALLVLTNVAMDGIVRSASRGDSRWMRALRDALSRPPEASHKSLDELRQKVEELKSPPSPAQSHSTKHAEAATEGSALGDRQENAEHESFR